MSAVGIACCPWHRVGRGREKRESWERCGAAQSACGWGSMQSCCVESCWRCQALAGASPAMFCIRNGIFSLCYRWGFDEQKHGVALRCCSAGRGAGLQAGNGAGGISLLDFFIPCLFFFFFLLFCFFSSLSAHDLHTGSVSIRIEFQIIKITLVTVAIYSTYLNCCHQLTQTQ